MNTGHSTAISVGSGTRYVQVKECRIVEIMATTHTCGIPCVSTSNSTIIYKDTTRLTPDNRLCQRNVSISCSTHSSYVRAHGW